MPFQCWLKPPLMSENGPIAGRVLVDRIIVRPFRMVTKGDPLFVAKSSEGLFEVRSNMNGGLAAFLPQEGDALPESDQFGCMHAEGEDIPYGHPYLIAIPIAREENLKS